MSSPALHSSRWRRAAHDVAAGGISPAGSHPEGKAAGVGVPSLRQGPALAGTHRSVLSEDARAGERDLHISSMYIIFRRGKRGECWTIDYFHFALLRLLAVYVKLIMKRGLPCPGAPRTCTVILCI